MLSVGYPCSYTPSHCCRQTPAPDGSGASTYLDGFYAASLLRSTNAAAFETLKNAVFRYRYLDAETGWHIEAEGPIIETDDFRRGKGGEEILTGVRHNDLDRIGALPPWDVQERGSDAVDAWYSDVASALDAWDEIVNDSANRITVGLSAGDTVVIHNRRVMHGRESFTLGGGGERTIVGCYTSAEDLESRWRGLFVKHEEAENRGGDR